MALNLAELTGEKLTVSRSGSNYSIPFLVWRGVPADPLPTKVDVYNRVRGYLKAGGFFTYLGMVLDQIDIDEQGGGVWKVNVSYKPPEGPQIIGDLADPDKQQSAPSAPQGGEALDAGISITLGETTTHITQSLETRESKLIRDGAIAPGGNGDNPKKPPNHKGAIGVTKDKVEGCDVPTGTMDIQVTRTLAYLTLDYIRALKALIGCTNNAPFWGFPAGAVRFKGATFNPKSESTATGELNAPFTGTFSFAIGENRTLVTVVPGLLVLDEVRAWDYLWVAYETKVSEGRTVETPFAAYVEKVRPEANFALISIGT